MAQKVERRKDPAGRVLKENELYDSARQLYIYRYFDVFHVRKQITAKTLQLLREKEKSINEAIHNNIDFARSRNTTLNDCFDFVIDLRDKQGRLRPTTKANYTMMWNNTIRESIGTQMVNNIRPAMLEAFFTMLTTDKGFSKNSNKFVFSLLRMSLQWAVDNSLILRNPCDNDSVRTAKASGKGIEKHIALSRNQVTALLDYMENSYYAHFKPFVLFAVHSGMRCSEICGLCWDDVNDADGIIKVTKQVQYKKLDSTTKYFVTLPKTAAGNREIDLDDGMRKALAEQRKNNFALGLMQTENIDGYDGFIFPTRTGKPMTVTSVNLALKRIVDRYNFEETEKSKGRREPELLPHISSHDLRHTAITLMLLSGMPIADVQARVGHETAEITMNVYNHSVKEERKRNTSLLDDFMKEA